MSSVTPASFIDDGSSFHKRTPHGLHPAHVSDWISNPDSDTSSAYTGSYIDDGADMLDPNKHAPGFGPIDARFYKQRKRKENEKMGPWNDDMQKAIAGDIQHNLHKMRGIGNLDIRKVGRHEAEEEKRDKHGRRKKDTVTIPMPPKWGTFVVKGDDGRVIVVDEDGMEFDSGPPQVPIHQHELPPRWVKAPSTVSIPSLPTPSLTSSEQRHSRDKHAKRHPRRDKKSKHNASHKVLTPIPESEYEDEPRLSDGEDLASPTGFFMTGGKDGWPSRSYSAFITAEARLTYTLPARYSSRKPHRSSLHEDDKVSAKSSSTYKPVTIEDAPDTSSENASIIKDAGWGGGWGDVRAGSEQSWGGNKKDSHMSSRHSTKAPSNAAWTASQAASDHHPSTSVQNWIGDKVKTISSASSHKSEHHSHRSHTRSHRSRSSSHAPSDKTSEASWDGYELPKSQSEVSVAGSGSERGWPGSQASSQHTSSHRSRKSSKSGGSDQWGGSQKANVDGWAGDQIASESGTSWKDGGEGSRAYSNGYDEDNETYLNDNWGGVAVRVRSRRESNSGWE
ncbi:hypothetical protein CC86DRAFT_322394 [Ophiobolus disseminans]|uniref:Uncharacterized protein n=1 Tax=Ophiobolus disseminans TaxID=1469910 RepID=A0A6A7A0H0_9PLEO|nr:hypothetical protein CC86DRAFT_322394 [Ophiobolus disseminans]